jgi:hypothetical protein
MEDLMVTQPILPLDDFLALTTDEQTEKLKDWKLNYTLRDIREAWGFKHPAQYFMLLKKLRIYGSEVNTPDNISHQQWLSCHTEDDGCPDQTSVPVEIALNQIVYELNATLGGPEMAAKLERLAQYLKGLHKEVLITMSITAATSENGIVRSRMPIGYT